MGIVVSREGSQERETKKLSDVNDHITKGVLIMEIMLDTGAYMPSWAHDTDAGLDLRTPQEVTVPAYGSATVDTGVHVALPHGCAGLLVSKSGLNVRHDITSTGLIDEGYTGSIVVKLYDHGGEDHEFEAGDKITQLVVIPVVCESLEQVSSFNPTERGDNGFGSTGR
nr:MAG: dUTPase [Bacteriophage sp.]